MSAEAVEAVRVPGWEVECWERGQALHTQMLSDIWTKTDEHKWGCSIPDSADPQADSRVDSRDCTDCRERESLQRQRPRRESWRCGSKVWGAVRLSSEF